MMIARKNPRSSRGLKSNRNAIDESSVSRSLDRTDFIFPKLAELCHTLARLRDRVLDQHLTLRWFNRTLAHESLMDDLRTSGYRRLAHCWFLGSHFDSDYLGNRDLRSRVLLDGLDGSNCLDFPSHRHFSLRALIENGSQLSLPVEKLYIKEQRSSRANRRGRAGTPRPSDSRTLPDSPQRDARWLLGFVGF